jgi:hypothetical protein
MKTYVRLTTQDEADRLVFKGSPLFEVQIFLDDEGVFSCWSDRQIPRKSKRCGSYFQAKGYVIRGAVYWIDPISPAALPLPVMMTREQICAVHEYWAAPGTRCYYDRSPIPVRL